MQTIIVKINKNSTPDFKQEIPCVPPPNNNNNNSNSNVKKQLLGTTINGNQEIKHITISPPNTLNEIMENVSLIKGNSSADEIVLYSIIYPVQSSKNPLAFESRCIAIPLLYRYTNNARKAIEEGFKEILKKSLQNFNKPTESESEKNNYIRRIEKLIVKAMTEEEVKRFELSLKAKPIDEWLKEDLPLEFDMNEENSEEDESEEHSEEAKFHYQSRLESLGYYLTSELGYFIANEMEINLPDPNLTTKPPGWIPDSETLGKFKDILELIEEKQNLDGRTDIMFYYKTYHLLKSLCFVLHDKPVDNFAPILFSTMKSRYEKQKAHMKPPDSKYNVLLNNLWEIWETGFNLTIGKPKVTQTRCHSTIQVLTKSFEDGIKQDGITVPKKIITFSVPYSSLTLDKPQEDLKKAVTFYSHGLSDAVGNDKYILALGKKAIFPKTCAQQDAAPNDKAGTTLNVVEQTTPLANRHLTHEYTVLNSETSHTEIISVEPQRFGDISIFCKQEDQGPGKESKSIFLYYASYDYFEDNVKAIIARESATIFAKSFPNVEPKLYNIIDEGESKILFAVITDRISQNETIPLIRGIIPSMEESARGKKTFSRKSISGKMSWLKTNPASKNYPYDPDSVELDNAICILLATFAKELGDQSKIQVVENVCRMPNNPKKSYVATVDSFFSESIVNGGVLFKGGNIILTEQAGFHVLHQAQVDNLFKIAQRAKGYGYDNFKKNVESLCSQIQILTEKAINAKNPFTIYLIYKALNKQATAENIIVSRDYYDSFLAKFDRANYTSISSQENLVQRFFTFNTPGNISDIFAIYENHNNDRFSMTVVNNVRRTELWDMIIDYNKQGFPLEPLFEEAPLFFLIEEIPKLKRIIYRKGRDHVDKTKEILTILGQKFVDKMRTFIATFNILMPITEMQILSILIGFNPYLGVNDDRGVPYDDFDAGFFPGNFFGVIQSIRGKLTRDKNGKVITDMGEGEMKKTFEAIEPIPAPETINEPSYSDVDSQQDSETDKDFVSDPTNVIRANSGVAENRMMGGFRIPEHVFIKESVDFPIYKKFLIEHFSRTERKTRKQKKSRSNKSRRKSLKKRK